MLLPLQVGCSKLASKARPFLLHYKLPETRCKKTQALMGATRPEAAEKCPDARRVAPIRAQSPGTTVLYMASNLLFSL